MSDLFGNPQLKPKFKPKSCGHCKEKFVPYKPLMQFCSPSCFWEAGKKKLALKQKREAQDWKKSETEKLMTKSDYEKLLETEINTIVRLIDKGCNCISCRPDIISKMIFAGHYRTVKSNPTIRYNLHQIHRQCFSCNGKGGGKPLDYMEGIIREYGEEYGEYVHHEIRRKWKYIGWTIDDLKGWIYIAKLIVKELKELGNNYTPSERIELRTEMNFRLSIYK